MIPDGLCHCGCGERTLIATKTRTRHGQVKGQPMRYLHNHHRRGALGPNTRYVEEDHGYLTPCQIAQGYVRRNGYVAQWHPTRKCQSNAHVVAWEAEHGPVPAGLELDHLCRIRACRRPDHLEPVTHAENLRRGRAAA